MEALLLVKLQAVATLLHGCFHVFYILHIIPNRAKPLIFKTLSSVWDETFCENGFRLNARKKTENFSSFREQCLYRVTKLTLFMWFLTMPQVNCTLLEKLAKWWRWWIVFCGMINRWKEFSLISSRDHFQRLSSSKISDNPRAGFELARTWVQALLNEVAQKW